MLDYATFDGHEAAHFAAALGLPFALALEVLDRRLRDDSWRRAPGGWFELFQHVRSHLPKDEVAERGAAFARALAAKPVDPAVPRFTEQLVVALCGCVHQTKRRDPELFEAIVAAVLDGAGPDHAGVVAAMFNSANGADPEGPTTKLADWLLIRGVSELTRPGSARHAMVRALLLARDPAALASAVRLVARDGQPPPNLSGADTDLLPVMWDKIERFDRSGPPEDDVCDLIVRFAEAVGWAKAFPVVGRHPRCVRLFVRCWIRGELRHPTALRTEIVVASPPDLEEFDGVPLDAVLKLGDLLRSVEGTPFQDRPTAERWTYLLTRAIVRAAGGLAGVARSEAIGRAIVILTGYPSPALGGARALQEEAAGAPADDPTVRLAVALLDQHGLELPVRIRAAALALGAPARPPTTDDVMPVSPSFTGQITHLLNSPWRTIHGLTPDRVYGGARHVRFERLGDDFQVVVRDGILVVHDDYPRKLAQRGDLSDERKLALLSVFVVHEAIHTAQGIGPAKQPVTDLRSTGNEQTLMHLDLSADHAAVQIVAESFPRWDLLWLKDLQGRSIVDFPVTPMHPFGSRMRKAARMAGLRLDYLVRRHRHDLRLGDGYVFAAFGAGGGPFQVLTSGPPVAVVFNGEITKEQAAVILSTLDVGRRDQEPLADRVDALDRTLREVLGLT